MFGFCYLVYSISPFPCVLHQHMLTGQWSNAVKLCRVAKVHDRVIPYSAPCNPIHLYIVLVVHYLYRQ